MTTEMHPRAQSSPFPPHPASGLPLPSSSPSQPRVGTGYNNQNKTTASDATTPYKTSDYHDAFSENTAYSNSLDNNYTTSSPVSSYSPAAASISSDIVRRSSTRQLEAFGAKFLSALSDNVKVPPSVTSLARKNSVHTRAKSLASFVPTLNSSLVEETNGASKARKTGRFSELFKAHELDEPAEVEEESEFIMEYRSSLTGGPERPSETRPQPALARSHTSRPSTSSVASKRFSNWFGSSNKAQPATPAQSALSHDQEPDILGNPTALLLPHGHIQENSEQAFPELLRNAEALIVRLQSAYRSQSTALQNARSEREAAIEQAEAARTRADHLRIQLNEMAEEAGEQKRAINAIAEELAAEKMRCVEETERWERMIKQREEKEGDVTPRSRRNRRSGGSSMASDSGFESDAETDLTSFSTCDEPSRPLTPVNSHPVAPAPQSIAEKMEALRPGSSTSLRGRSIEVDAGVWIYMREEKTRLESRLRELEGAIEGAMDLCIGV